MTGPGITRRFIIMLAAVLVLNLLLTVVWGTGWGMAFCLYGVLLLFWLLDFLLTPGKRHFNARRETPRRFEQRMPAPVTLTIAGDRMAMSHLRIADSPPHSFRARRDSRLCPVKNSRAVYTYEATATQRGRFTFGRCYVEALGPWKLSCKRFSLPCDGEARVYPNLEAMRRYRLLAEKNQLSREDTALHSIRGNGAEFAGLKEYVPGDDWRRINWKASARAGKMISNVYDVEKNREVILAVDAGRWMCAPMGEVTRLDRALELAAAVMQVAISSGDRVGLLVYGADTMSYLPPGKGIVHTQTILNTLYGVTTQTKQSSFAALSAHLCNKLTKRAFICMFTYIDSPEEAMQVIGELAPLSRRHSLYLASLTDAGLGEIIDRKVAAPQDMYLKAAATFRETAALLAAEVFRKNGIGAHAAEPGELLTQSVRHYLSLKRMNR